MNSSPNKSMVSYHLIFFSFLLSLLYLFPSLSIAQKKEPSDKKKASIDQVQIEKYKVYNDVITPNANTQKGFLTVHQIEGDYYFELPKSLLEKDILIASRISRMPHQFSPYGSGVYTRPGAEHQVIRFQKKGNFILMRLVSHNDVEKTESPIQQSVLNNNFEAIIFNFKIETMGINSDSYVINVTSFFTSDIPLIGVESSDISGVDKSRSMIKKIRVFAKNIEVQHVLTYRTNNRPYSDRNNSLSFELNQSFVLLPKDPMIPRLHDWRVNFLSVKKTNYSLDYQEVIQQRYITRWRLEPSNWATFKRGELVEPIKPIVFYLDPATPDVWKPFIKQGVEDWKRIFENIGFKNVIQVKHPPTKIEEPEWDINNFQYSVIRYIASKRGAAASFNVYDPRSGEILKTDIHLSQGYFDYIKKLFFIQTAATNPDARTLRFKDEVMGELIRSVISHEVGHSLGLSHNMKASLAYHPDSLRSSMFTSTHGLSASIMDYTFGNYLAQPEDSITNFYTKIGEHDEWAIKYGYRPIDQNISPEIEKEVLNLWISEKVNNALYRPWAIFQEEMDLGNDPLQAAKLGINNLKKIAKNLIVWTMQPGESHKDLSDMREMLYKQFYYCLEPIVHMISGSYNQPKSADEAGVVYKFIPEVEQRKAFGIINEYILQTPSWLIDIETQQRISSGISRKGTINQIKILHKKFLDGLLQNPMTMMENEAFNGEKAYTISELYYDLRINIFNELKSGNQIDIYRRNLQKMMVEQLIERANNQTEFYNYTDVSSIATGNLIALQRAIKRGIKKHKDSVSKYHLQQLLIKIDGVLKGNKTNWE